ncbi:MAG: electron transfer flavoprotein subunit alpha/FixB family protein [Candidatus Methanomethylicia archaeon]
MSGEVWVYAECRSGRLMDVSIELINGARKIADKIKSSTASIILTDNVGQLADELISYGVDKVYVVEHPLLRLYQNDLYTDIICEAVLKYNPEILLIGATSIGMDLAPRIAARLKTGLSAHIVGLDIDENGILKQIVPGFGGGVMAVVTCPKARPQIATVRPGVLAKPEKTSKKGEIINFKTEISEEKIKARTLEIVEEEPLGKPLEEAEIVVGVGLGGCKPETFKLIRDLAETLGAAIGGTRPAVDEGYIKEDQMIGQSGKTVRPKIHIALGVSGAMQYMVGVMDSKTIIAVNKDPNAPIFKMCDIGIVGDLNDVLPILLEEIKQLRKT